MTTTPAPSVLAVNPGGTSTKVALFRGDDVEFSVDVRHDPRELDACGSLAEQVPWRLGVVRAELEKRGVDIGSVEAVSGRGGPVAPVPCGTFAVDEALLAAIREGRVMVEHPSLLGAPMAHELAREAGCPAYVVDPVSVDELADRARMTGLPRIPRRALSHALSIKAAARAAAEQLGSKIEEINLIVLHLGSGFTVAAQRGGRQVDSTDASASGPMAPTRTGALPALDLVRLACGGELSLSELEHLLVGGGGWMAHLGTADIREIYTRVDAGDEAAARVLEATLYQLSKETGAMVAALGGEVAAIVVTGGVARSERFAGELEEELSWFGGRIIVLPGENEMTALARGALRVLRDEAKAVSMGPHIDKERK